MCKLVKESKVLKWGLFEFRSSTVPWNIMLTSLLADKFIKLEGVKDKLIRYVNLTIDNQVLLLHGMSKKSVILHEEITSSQADTESVVGSTGTHFAIFINLHVPRKKKLLWRWARRVRVEFRDSLLLEIMAKMLKMRGDIGGEAVDVVCGAPAMAISGFHLQEFNFSETVPGKWLDGQTLSGGVFDNAWPPQFEFSNLQILPLTFYLDFLAGRS